ncbi:hypothetical protein D3C71_1795220 [compost metagenome]
MARVAAISVIEAAGAALRAPRILNWAAVMPKPRNLRSARRVSARDALRVFMIRQLSSSYSIAA